MNISSLLARIPAQLQIPTFEEMHARTQQLKRLREVEVTRLGVDRVGLPIDMISVGEGSTSVLVIGAPHPNEPIGCVGIEWMIQQLLNDDGLRRDAGLRWHFVKAIEPYALQQNEGWFRRRDLSTYYEHFYRPALAQQAEYSFPSSSAQAHDGVVENAAYRRALELARPALLASLHNAENAGAFYFLSRRDDALADALSRQPASHGLPLNTAGEQAFGGNDVALAPGVFLPGPSEPAEGTGGALSVGEYLAANGQATQVLVPEVPMFRDAGSPMPDAADGLRADVELALALRTRVAELAEDAAPLERWYIAAIQENVDFAVGSQSGMASFSGRYSPSEHHAHLRASRLFALRPIAMMARLFGLRMRRERNAHRLDALRSAQDLARHHVRAVLESTSIRDALKPSSLSTCVAAQLDAVLTAASRAA